MSMFRAKKLDLGCYVNIRVIRDHTKRKVYEQFETQRYEAIPCLQSHSQSARFFLWEGEMDAASADF